LRAHGSLGFLWGERGVRKGEGPSDKDIIYCRVRDKNSDFLKTRWAKNATSGPLGEKVGGKKGTIV